MQFVYIIMAVFEWKRERPRLAYIWYSDIIVPRGLRLHINRGFSICSLPRYSEFRSRLYIFHRTLHAQCVHSGHAFFRAASVRASNASLLPVPFWNFLHANEETWIGHRSRGRGGTQWYIWLITDGAKPRFWVGGRGWIWLRRECANKYDWRTACKKGDWWNTAHSDV